MSPPSRDELREKLAVAADSARSWVSGMAAKVREFVESRPGLGRIAGIWAVVVIVALGLVGIAIGRRDSGGSERSTQVPVPAITATPRSTEREAGPGSGAPPVPGPPPEPERSSTNSARAPEPPGPPTPSTRPSASAQPGVPAQPGASAQPSPSTQPSPSAQPSPPSGVPRLPGQGVEHVVVRGETLAAIALRYQVPFEQIAAENSIADPNRIRTGQRLVIGAKPAGVVVIEPGRTLSDYARSSGRGLDELMRMNPHLANPNRILAGGRLNV